MWLFNKKKVSSEESLRTIDKLVEYIQEARKSNYDDKKIFDFFWKNKYPEQIVKNAFTIADYELMKGGANMRFGKKESVLEEAEEQDEQFSDDNQDLEEKPKTILKPVAREQRKAEDKYSAFHVAERVGIVDNETKIPIAEGTEGLYVAIALILSKLDKIESSVG